MAIRKRWRPGRSRGAGDEPGAAQPDPRPFELALWLVRHRSDGTLRECFRDRCEPGPEPREPPVPPGE